VQVPEDMGKKRKIQKLECSTDNWKPNWQGFEIAK
jgi:hypothetical protein